MNDTLTVVNENELGNSTTIPWRCHRCHKEIPVGEKMVCGFTLVWKDQIDSYCEKCFAKDVANCKTFTPPYDLESDFERLEIYTRPTKGEKSEGRNEVKG